jgi:DNA-binding CsgD family transcriptional regulator
MGSEPPPTTASLTGTPKPRHEHHNSSDPMPPAALDETTPPQHNTGMAQLVVAPALTQLHRCKSSQQMRAGLLQLALSLGFEVAIAAIEDWRTFGAPIRHLVSTMPEAWNQIYLSRSLHRDSPVVRHCRTSTEPLVWVAKRRVDEAPEYWSTAQQFNLHEGLSLSSHRPQSLALLTLARSEGAFSASPDRPVVPPEYSMLPGLVHECLLEIVERERMPICDQQFSAREIECLHWAARGKTSADTALLLHLSEATVNFHLQRVMAKLKASNRQQAVAIATAMGLFNTTLAESDTQTGSRPA